MQADYNRSLFAPLMLPSVFQLNAMTTFPFLISQYMKMDTFPAEVQFLLNSPSPRGRYRKKTIINSSVPFSFLGCLTQQHN